MNRIHNYINGKKISYSDTTLAVEDPSIGEKIAEVAAPMFKKLSLELGGKNPNIIFADANFEDAMI